MNESQKFDFQKFEFPSLQTKENNVKKIIELVDEGKIDRDELIRDLLNWMYPSDLSEFVHQYKPLSDWM